MEPDTAPQQDSWRLGRGPFIFSGVPPLCVGDIDLINESDEKVRVRTIAVVGDSSFASLGVQELRVATPLKPGHRTRARAYFRLDPFTPPGTYRADVSSGGRQEPLVLHVWERRMVRVDPGDLRLRGGAGEALTALVVVKNEGNVTEYLRDVALVFLEEHDWVGRSAVFALRETKAAESHQAYLDRVLAELKGTLARPARVTVRSKATELQPGETREVELGVTLPAELRKGRTYFGSTRFMSSKLIFQVECTASEHSAGGRAQ